MLREAQRRECLLRDAELDDIAGQFAVERQARRQPAGSRAGLDSVAALAREPEKAGRRVVADHQVLVGHETPEARPFVLEAAYLQCRRRLDAVDGDGDRKSTRL